MKLKPLIGLVGAASLSQAAVIHTSIGDPIADANGVDITITAEYTPWGVTGDHEGHIQYNVDFNVAAFEESPRVSNVYIDAINFFPQAPLMVEPGDDGQITQLAANIGFLEIDQPEFDLKHYDKGFFVGMRDTFLVEPSDTNFTINDLATLGGQALPMHIYLTYTLTDFVLPGSDELPNAYTVTELIETNGTFIPEPSTSLLALLSLVPIMKRRR